MKKEQKITMEQLKNFRSMEAIIEFIADATGDESLLPVKGLPKITGKKLSPLLH